MAGTKLHGSVTEIDAREQLDVNC